MRPLPPLRRSDPLEGAPVPSPSRENWRGRLGKWLRRDHETRWGGQLLRISSDMILICDESLEILHHNRAFLKRIGHVSGSYRGRSFTEFFPVEDGQGVCEAFAQWRQGHAAGMRFQASLLTKQGRKTCDFRAVRSRSGERGYRYYLVAREADEAKRQLAKREEDESDPFFRGLPVAAWRTDAQLRISHAYGSLWPELGLACEDLLGESLTDRHHCSLPRLLPTLDCGAILAGETLQTSLQREGWPYQVRVEPVFNASGEFVGSLGLLRRQWQESPVEPAEPMSCAIPPSRHHVSGAALSGRVPAMRSTGGRRFPPISGAAR